MTIDQEKELKNVKNLTPDRIGSLTASFFQSLVTEPNITKSEAYMKFCEFGELTFRINDIKKYKEGYLDKESGGRYKEKNKCKYKYCSCLCKGWSKRWFIITGDFILYTSNIESYEAHELFIFDDGFNIIADKYSTGNNYTIVLKNRTRDLYLKADDEIEKIAWENAIRRAYNESQWSKLSTKSFGFFSPLRFNNSCQWIVDANDYFTAVYHELKKAKREVYITDWWLTPKLYLERRLALDRNCRNESSRLDLVLKKIADKGVIIYVIMFKEVELALGLNSNYSKTILTNSSPNIRVLRHPRTLISFWSHHEKLIIIDQKIVFMGGLDLAWGRMDFHSHPLLDLPDNENNVIFPGQDYNNVRLADFRDVDNSELCLIDRNTQPRMPWHDIAIVLKGKIVKDLVRHFSQYWNHAMLDVSGVSHKGKILDSGYHGSDELGWAKEDKEVILFFWKIIGTN